MLQARNLIARRCLRSLGLNCSSLCTYRYDSNIQIVQGSSNIRNLTNGPLACKAPAGMPRLRHAMAK